MTPVRAAVVEGAPDLHDALRRLERIADRVARGRPRPGRRRPRRRPAHPAPGLPARPVPGHPAGPRSDAAGPGRRRPVPAPREAVVDDGRAAGRPPGVGGRRRRPRAGRPPAPLPRRRDGAAGRARARPGQPDRGRRRAGPPGRRLPRRRHRAPPRGAGRAPRAAAARGAAARRELCVIGMGKLGGEELNFASDIDVIYAYTSDEGQAGELSLHEFFSKLCERVTTCLHEVTDEDVVFRVDLRLRPEGSRGAIANSLPSMERYYETWGRPWERQAWLKARASAGSQVLGPRGAGHPGAVRPSAPHLAVRRGRGARPQPPHQGGARSLVDRQRLRRQERRRRHPRGRVLRPGAAAHPRRPAARPAHALDPGRARPAAVRRHHQRERAQPAGRRLPRAAPPRAPAAAGDRPPDPAPAHRSGGVRAAGPTHGPLRRGRPHRLAGRSHRRGGAPVRDAGQRGGRRARRGRRAAVRPAHRRRGAAAARVARPARRRARAAEPRPGAPPGPVAVRRAPPRERLPGSRRCFWPTWWRRRIRIRRWHAPPSCPIAAARGPRCGA